MSNAETPKYPCPCCGYITLDEGPGLYDICPICDWEDDLSQLRFPTTLGANKVSLIEAQQNFIKIGAKSPEHIDHIDDSISDYKRDPQWRPIDPDKDYIEIPISGKEYGMTYPKDSTELYYWRHPRKPL
jgi:Cysteine-rich CPCC